MTEIVILAVLVSAVLAFAVFRRYGAETVVAVGVVLSTCLLPIAFGRAPLSTYSVAVLLGLGVLITLRRVKALDIVQFFPFLVLGVFGVFFFWDGGIGPAQELAYFLIACLAWAVGASTRKAIRNSERRAKLLVIIISAVLALQALISGLQVAGIQLFATGELIAELTAGRSNGTFAHPGTLGKAMVCLLALLLPFTLSESRVVRRWALLAMPIGLIPLLLSISRANIVAAAVLLIVWIVFAPRKKTVALKTTAAAALGIAAILFLDQVLARFEADKQGGERSRFLNVALEHIPDHLWLGVGPNNYVNYFGQFDSLTAEGWPVHNTFLLAVAEVGVLGALLLFGPWLLSMLRAAFRMFSRHRGAVDYRAYIAFALSILPIALTGWGMLTESIMPLWFFVSAFLMPRWHVTARRLERPLAYSKVIASDQHATGTRM